MAAHPFGLAALVEDAPFRVESACAWGGRLLLGSADGTLAVYAPSAPGSPARYEALEVRRQFAPRAIAQMEAHERLGLLVLLSDGLVRVHALDGLQQLAVLGALRGCGALALTRASDAGECLLAVSCRREVHVLRWTATARTFVDVAEVAVPDGPSSGGGVIPPHLKAAVAQLTDAVTDAVGSVAKDGAISIFGGGGGGGVGGGSDGSGGGGGGASSALATLLVWLADGSGARELLIGTRREYFRFELASRELSALFKTARAGGAAVGARVGQGEVLLCQERIGCFVGLGGAPSRKFQLSFREPPALVCACGPFLLSLAARAPAGAGGAGGAGSSGGGGGGAGGAQPAVEVRLLQTQDVVQTIALPALGGGLLCPFSLGGARPGGGEGGSGPADGGAAEQPRTIVFGGSAGLVALEPLALPELQRRLVLARRFDEAAALCASAHGQGTDAERAARRGIERLRGYALLRERRFDAGCAALGDARARPLAVLSLYPKLLPSGVSQERVVVSLGWAVQGGDDLRSGEGRGEPGGGAACSIEVPPLELSEQAQIVALYTALRAFLERARRDPELLPPSPSERAAEAPRLSAERAAAERAAADTALLKILLSVDQPAVLPFLKQPNACVLPEVEAILLRYRQIDELVGLWHGRGLHAKALEMLASLGQQGGALAAGIAGGSEAAAFGGLRATVEYLRSLPAAEMPTIAAYAAWPLRAAPDDALRIFCDPEGGARRARRPGGPLPLDSAYDCICALAGRPLGLRFLESALAPAPPRAGARAAEPLGSARLHDELAAGLLAAVSRLCGAEDGDGDGGGDGDGAAASDPVAEPGGHLSDGVASAVPADGAAGAPAAAGPPAGLGAEAAAELARARARFAAFVRSSRKVDCERLLGALAAGASATRLHALAPERALLLRMLGEHEAALRLLAVDAGDMAAAEAYCAQAAADALARAAAHAPAEPDDELGPSAHAAAVLAARQPATQTAYDALVRVLLRPADGRAADVPAALRLLCARSAEIDAASALELLPPHAPLCALAGWLRGSLRAHQQGGRAAQLERNLRKTDSLAARVQLGEVRRRAVEIKPETPCAVCGKRIGTTVFARYPNGLVVHLVCSGDDLHACPVTREDFRRQALSAATTR